jgi:hypothetical protein
MDHRVALLGTSLTIASIGAALADVPGLELLPIELWRDADLAGWGDAHKPDVVIFDLVAGLPDSTLCHLAARSDLALIGLDLETRRMLLLSGEEARLLTTDDLVRAVKKLAPVENPAAPG